MECPHCNVMIQLVLHSPEVWRELDYSVIPNERDYGYQVAYGHCPNCNKLIVLLQQGQYIPEDDVFPAHGEGLYVLEQEIIYPRFIARKVDIEVPKRFREDYVQATSVLPLSPKASAALSRRILQDVIHEQFKIEKRSLDKEIEEFINLQGIPSHLAKAIDAVRNIGNFAAHPLKDTNTGEIVEVEPGEAEWLLEVLDSLFDFVFVQPKRLEERKNNLNQKLQSLGKPPMK